VHNKQVGVYLGSMLFRLPAPIKREVALLQGPFFGFNLRIYNNLKKDLSRELHLELGMLNYS